MSLYGIAIGAGAGVVGLGAAIFGLGAIKRAWNYISSGTMKADVKAGCGHVSYLVKMMFWSVVGSAKDGGRAVIDSSKYFGRKLAGFGTLCMSPFYWLYNKCYSFYGLTIPNTDAEAEEAARIARQVAEQARVNNNNQ